MKKNYICVYYGTNLLKKYKDKEDILENAYSDKNAPSGFPLRELDKRQKEIQQFKFNYEKMEKEFNVHTEEKYRFRGQITEDYNQKEEYKFMTRNELNFRKRKIS